jgi:hypothetical protein
MPNDVYRNIKGDVLKTGSGKNKFSPMVLRGGVKGELLLPDFEKLEFSKLGTRPETRICADFRVPPMYAGFNSGLDKSTYNNVAEARAGFVEDSVIPLAEQDAEDITVKLQRFFGNDFKVMVDTSNMYALEKKNAARAEQANKAYAQYGTLTLNEARAENRLARFGGPEGDQLKQNLITPTPTVTSGE